MGCMTSRGGVIESDFLVGRVTLVELCCCHFAWWRTIRKLLLACAEKKNNRISNLNPAVSKRPSAAGLSDSSDKMRLLPPSGNSLTSAPSSFSLDWPLTSCGWQSAGPKCVRLLCFLFADPVDMEEARLSRHNLSRVIVCVWDQEVQRNALIDWQRYWRCTSSKPYWYVQDFFSPIHWINPTRCGSEVLDGSRWTRGNRRSDLVQYVSSQGLNPTLTEISAIQQHCEVHVTQNAVLQTFFLRQIFHIGIC